MACRRLTTTPSTRSWSSTRSTSSSTAHTLAERTDNAAFRSPCRPTQENLHQEAGRGVDTLGLPVMITVTPADTTDRDAARELLWRLRVMQPPITQVWADSAYAGQLINWSDDFLHRTLKTVSRPRGAKGFVVLPRRWKVERTLDRITKSRRNVRDYERLPQHSEAHLVSCASS
ncbi:transposase [Streptomyces sp. NPDC005071]